RGRCVEKITCPAYIKTDNTVKSLDTIAVFNVLNLGWSNNKDTEAIACIINHFNITGLVEVQSVEAVAELKTHLEKLSGDEWGYHVSSEDVGRSSHKEHYAFVWREKEVSMTGVIGFYPEKDDEFIREPYAASFFMDSFSFVFALIHVIYGKNKSMRRAEVRELNDVYLYFQGLCEDEDDIIIGGDFNIPVSDSAFTIFETDEFTYAAPETQKTTIGYTGLSSSYDNILFSLKYTDEYSGKSGVLDFTDDNHKKVRKFVSDHLPVWIAVD
ncbi:MAG: endonuclease/exonuclease/phosphatase family protein, partial [bacterium]